MKFRVVIEGIPERLSEINMQEPKHESVHIPVCLWSDNL